MPIMEKGLGIDHDRLIKRTFAILPDRDRYFNDLIQQFKKKYPQMKIVYANNMMGARMDPSRPNPDFIIIAKYTVDQPGRRPINVMMVDAPMLFTDRALAGWTISVESGNLNGYFDYMMEKALRIDQTKFYEYIQHMALLSLDPQNELYWKKIENADRLVKDLSELYARYNKKTGNKMQDARGYQTPTK